MIERYRESWFTDVLERTTGDWTGLFVIGGGLALFLGLHLMMKYANKVSAAKKDTTHD